MSETLTARRTRCEQCAGPLPLLARADARFCDVACKQTAYRQRRRAKADQVSAERAARIPTELTARPRWVRYSSRKVPLRVDGRFASVSYPSSWSDFSAAANASCGQGFGYVLAAGDGVVVIDLDHAVVNGRVLSWAQRIIDSLPATYMERGRSGTGLHLWFRGEVPAGRRVRRGDVAVEVYGEGRYIIVGARVDGTPLELAELPNAAGFVASLT